PVRIVIVDTGSRSGANLYLTRALAIGDMPKFEILNRQPNAVSDDDLRRASVVLVNDVDVNVGLARRLARFVQDGGGLLVAAGPRARGPREAVGDDARSVVERSAAQARLPSVPASLDGAPGELHRAGAMADDRSGLRSGRVEREVAGRRTACADAVGQAPAARGRRVVG